MYEALPGLKAAHDRAEAAVKADAAHRLECLRAAAPTITPEAALAIQNVVRAAYREMDYRNWISVHPFGRDLAACAETNA